MQIDINSRLIALIGTPLSQSFAARMQNSAYQAAGFNMVYCYCEADSTHLKEIIDGADILGLRRNQTQQSRSHAVPR